MRRAASVAPALLLAMALAACARQSEMVVLLPDPESGEVGRASVRAGGAEVPLDAAGEGTRVQAGRAPSAPRVVPASEIEKVFGPALAMRPRAARHFVLQFAQQDDLTPESQAMLDEVLREVNARTAPEVSVIGHTDRTGDAEVNFRVGLSRANVVRAFLVSKGIAERLITVASHGEADPAVATADGVAEPRNRRVEVTVR